MCVRVFVMTGSAMRSKNILGGGGGPVHEILHFAIRETPFRIV